MATTPIRIVAILSLLASASAAADTGDEAAGEKIYQRHCATCHGIEATGQGPMAAVLTLQPTNLTALTAGNDGVFPVERVIRRIDGRDPLVAHGSPMPVYGDFFRGRTRMLKTDSGQPIETTAPIADLVAYLRSLQVHQD